MSTISVMHGLQIGLEDRLQESDMVTSPSASFARKLRSTHAPLPTRPASMRAGAPVLPRRFPPSASWKVLGLALVLLTVTAGALSPMLKGEFVWDDELYIVSNEAIHAPDGWRQIWLSPTSSPQYYPLVFTSFWIEYRLWGLNPCGYLAVNLALHIANALLLWGLLSHLMGRGAFLAAMIFAVHPIHVESVALVAERKDVLATLFLLATTTVWLRFTARPGWRTYAGALVLFAATMLSKTASSPLPLVLLLLAWWQEPDTWRRRIVQLVPFFGVAVATTTITLWREQLALSIDPLTHGLTFWDRCALAAHNVWFYIGKLAWPANLSLIYPPVAPQGQTVVSCASIAGIVAVLATTWALRDRLGRGPFVAVAAFLVMLAPILGFIDFAYLRHSFVADHFVYVPSIAVIALFSALVARVRYAPRSACRAGAAVLVGVLAWATWQRSKVFDSAEGLWLDTLAKNPRSWAAHANLGVILQKNGRLDDAVAQYAMAIEAKPDYFEALFNTGTVRILQHRNVEAKRALDAAAALRPWDEVTQQDLGYLLTLEGKYAEAEPHWRAAIRANPHSADLRASLAFSLESQGRWQEAADAYRSALKINPAYTEARRRLESLTSQRRERYGPNRALEPTA